MGLLGKEKSESGVAEALQPWSGKYGAGIMHLCRGCETAGYPHKAVKLLNV